MRKFLLTLLFVIPGTMLAFGDQPYFLLVKAGNDTARVTKELQTKGIVVQQNIPPSILIVKAPGGFNFLAIPSISTVYSSVIPLENFKSYGPLGLAAVVAWNKEIRNAQTLNSNMVGAQAVMAQIAPAPQKISTQPHGSFLKVEWESVPGVLLYQIELVSSQGHQSPLQTITTACSVLLPVPFGIDDGSLSVRIRSYDRPDSNDLSKDVAGDWSMPVPVEAPIIGKSTVVAIPVLSSPIDGFQTAGYHVHLEWNQPSVNEFRIQVSNDPLFKTTLVDEGVPAPLLPLPEDVLHTGDILYWRVQAWGSKHSDWSPARNIQIGAPRNQGADMMINPEARR